MHTQTPPMKRNFLDDCHKLSKGELTEGLEKEEICHKNQHKNDLDKAIHNCKLFGIYTGFGGLVLIVGIYIIGDIIYYWNTPVLLNHLKIATTHIGAALFGAIVSHFIGK